MYASFLLIFAVYLAGRVSLMHNAFCAISVFSYLIFALRYANYDLKLYIKRNLFLVMYIDRL